jgi:RNA polymerase sigma factor (sigma-70 family)
VLPPDPQLVEALRSGDVHALEALVREYREPLRRYAERILETQGGGDDVVQEVFIRLWTRRGALGGEGSLRSLLYTMTRNAAIDEHRRARRAAEKTAQIPEPSSAASPYESTVEGELAGRAAAAVSALPARRQEVFRLIRECGLSYEEVAGVMEIAPQTVANHMSLALASLREVLASVMVEDAGEDRVMGGAHDVSPGETK